MIMAIGTLALCYNNVQLFRGVVKLRRGLTAKVIDRTKTMADVYGAFYDFSCMLKTKVDKNDPNASNTLNRLEAVQKVCKDTGVLHKRKSYVNDEGQSTVYVETVDEYDEYCHYAAGLVGLGLSKLLLASGLEVLTPDWKQISNSTGLFLQKTNIIKDYLEDINEIPKPRMFWPREIWGKYVDKLEDLKNEENSTKAVQCLNEMVTNALIHVEDCLKSMAGLRDPAIFKSCSIPQIVAMGTLALCYNNVQVFRGVVKLRRGLIAKVIDRTKTMDDVYGAFYDFSCMLKTKVDKNDPNAIKTLKRLEAIEKVCRENGDLHKRKSYVNNETQSKALLVGYFNHFLMLVPLLAILVLAYLKHTHINASDRLFNLVNSRS
ncbi:hypothetical protein F2Q70_00033953 [Brassica cretica]|uniref:Squalene synthase n=1 Tax=Brassica cretica TaxID=69181 RepID=A0A8S9JMV4_BRACR|nr:hypothetical protein F2Q70_00033953 [Brassica cretica]